MCFGLLRSHKCVRLRLRVLTWYVVNWDLKLVRVASDYVLAGKNREYSKYELVASAPEVCSPSGRRITSF
jgi:hypothetical protein